MRAVSRWCRLMPRLTPDRELWRFCCCIGWRAACLSRCQRWYHYILNPSQRWLRDMAGCRPQQCASVAARELQLWAQKRVIEPELWPPKLAHLGIDFWSREYATLLLPVVFWRKMWPTSTSPPNRRKPFDSSLVSLPFWDKAVCSRTKTCG